MTIVIKVRDDRSQSYFSSSAIDDRSLNIFSIAHVSLRTVLTIVSKIVW